MKRFSLTIIVFCLVGFFATSHCLLGEEGKDGKLLVPASTEGKPITNADVELLIKVADQAVVEKKADLMEPILADDLKVIMKNVPTPQGPQTMEMKKSEYLESMKQGWAAAEKYEYSKKDVTIDVAKDGKSAITKDIITEKITMSGKTLETTTKEVVTIEIRNGKPVITIIDGEVLEMK